MHTACGPHARLPRIGTRCVWSEKLPFAKYSVVKERFHAAPAERSCHEGRENVLGLGFSLGLFHCEKTGGEYRARTGDLLVANQALSQLS